MHDDGSQISVDLAHQADFDLGGMRVRPSIRQVEFNGTTEALEPRPMQVLVALWRGGGEVVSRDDLIETCWG
jgi:DNA-binding winged helix-turn-helix (wHTH) protein